MTRGLNDNIRFLGNITETELFYCSVDILIQTSRYEGMSYSILEAMSWGIPVVAYDVVGVQDAVITGQTGLLARLDNEEELADHIIELSQNAEMRRRLGAEARNRVKKHFTLSAQIQKTIDIYKNLTLAESSELRVLASNHEMQRMRILFVSHSGNLGGAERSMLELVRAMNRSVFNVFVACPVPSPLAHSCRQCAKVIPLSLGNINRRPSPWRLLPMIVFVVLGVIRLAYCIWRYRIDVVHANSTVSQLCAGPAALLTRVTSIWHWRDFYEHPRLNRLLATVTDGCVAISRAMYHFASTQINGTKKVYLVINGVEDKHANDTDHGDVTSCQSKQFRVAWDIGIDDVVVTMLAQVVPRKGHDIVMKAFAVAIQCNSKLRLVLAYPVDSWHDFANVQRLKRLAFDLGCSQYVRFLEDTRCPETVLCAADLVLVPSWREPFGRVAVEGMLAAKPIIATDVDGLAEIVVDGTTGILVPPGDETKLGEAILKLANSPELRRAMGQAGRAGPPGIFPSSEYPPKWRTSTRKLAGR